ncbi:DNA polymerase III [Fructobacillus fructosus]|uniref:DNA polymerase III subunit gamma/tau n=1 Tax=Fructobacillus fructosus TaxID=1631 RepID=UPI00021954BF|nr:DNA polymerase III subunit gamma/tau [Fructobacillus fructosus]KRN52419.1 DNA polymerase III subunits gamma and tau [Fructobacillus fructosus KCTC 3544]GAP01733.1 DNA polymerase III subunits gamma and tau [Fructobacillus fructosus]CAK1239596.1 DNA polymerase III [Fructobacillus fructosus]
MAYQALYRVYRPKTFSEMVGQEVITKTLQNAIDQHQTGHAYLFAGPRGTGKTSAAKIFAREVNGIGPDQAGQSQPDIIEIDAASNNGVDEIRSIRDSANYAPIEAPYKIYIIDEAHMLSTGAFNALLKTLEEPPAQVKFILATTEIQKMPATILSRTQRFEFKRLSNQTIKNRLVEILKQEKQDYEEAALDVVATAAEGGMRDALSIMDQVIAFGPDKVTLDNALTVTGSVDIDQVLAYLNQVMTGQTAVALETLSQILLSGKDANRFLSDLIATLRDVMLVDLAPDLVKAKSKESDLKAFLKASSQEQIQEMLQVIDQTKTALAQSLQSDIYLEILTVQLAQKSNPANANTSIGHATSSKEEPKSAAKRQEPVEEKPTKTVEQAAPVEASAAHEESADSESEHGTNGVLESKRSETKAMGTPSSRSTEEPVAERSAGSRVPEERPADEVTEKPERPVEKRSLDNETTTGQAETGTAATATATVATEATATGPALRLYTGNEPVQAVLSQAKRDKLNQAQAKWTDIIATMPVKDQAVLQTAEPVAASLDAIVLAFDYPALEDKAEKDAELQAQLAQALIQSGLPVQLVLRTKDEWHNDRAEYVKALKAGQTVKIALSDLSPIVVNQETTQQTATPQETKGNDHSDVVASAKALFGDDIVQVKTETK